MSEPFSKSVQKRVEHITGEKLFTEADLRRAREEEAERRPHTRDMAMKLPRPGASRGEGKSCT